MILHVPEECKMRSKAKKNKSYVSKLPRAFVFRCAFDSVKFKVWIFFACLIFSSSFFMTCLSKNTRKDMTDTMKHFEQQTSSTLVFCLVSCTSKIKFHIFQSCDQLKSDTFAAQKKKNVKKNAFRSGLPICHELWDIAFIFFSLILQKLCLGHCQVFSLSTLSGIRNKCLSYCPWHPKYLWDK